MSTTDKNLKWTIKYLQEIELLAGPSTWYYFYKKPDSLFNTILIWIAKKMYKIFESDKKTHQKEKKSNLFDRRKRP